MLLLAALGAVHAQVCTSGPTPGTADPAANYSDCLLKQSGSTCQPKCDSGYRPSGTIQLGCVGGFFDASSVTCIRNKCTNGALWNKDPLADYSECNKMLTGDLCRPTCVAGYHNTSDGFELKCFNFDADDVKHTVYLYDAAGFRCVANGCSSGPTPGTGDSRANYSGCSKLTSGSVCGAGVSPPNVECEPGLRLVGVQELICDRGGYYDAGRVVCEDVWCTTTQYVSAHNCSSCPMSMESTVGVASAAGPDTTCRESLGLQALKWGFLWHTVFPLSHCDVFNEPDYFNMPYLLSPSHLSVGTSPVRHLSGCLVAAFSSLFVIASANRVLGKRFPQLPLHGLLFALFFWLLPGISFSLSRIFTEWYHEPSRVDTVDIVVECLSLPVCLVFLFLTWYTVLRPGVFFARASDVEVEMGMWRFSVVFGSQTWEPCDIGLNFPRNKGLVFRWYAGHARWFMLVEAAFTVIVSGIVAKLPSTKENCMQRNWPLVAVCALWFLTVSRLQPMRAPLGNVLVVSTAAVQLLGVTMVAHGLTTQRQLWYTIADVALSAAAVLQWVKTVHDAALLIHESYHNRQVERSGERAAKASSDLEGRRDDELVRALHRLHATAGDLHPVAARTQRDVGLAAATAVSTGLGERLAGGLNTSSAISMCTPGELRERMCNWATDLREGYGAVEGLFEEARDNTPNQMLMTLAPFNKAAFSAPLIGRDIPTAPGLLGWLERVPRVWSSLFPDDTRIFYDCDIVCSGRHLPRQRAGFKEKVCCISWNLRHILRRMLPDVIANSKAWVALMRERLQPAWLEATDGIVAVLVYTYESLRPAANGQSREMQIYAEMNLAMREMGDPMTRSGLEPSRSAKHRKKLQFFLPLIERLETFLTTMRGAPGMVFRGISVRVAEQYRSGTSFLWGSFSSTSGKSSVARYFMKGAGSLFIAAHRRAVDVSYLSVYPVESELVLPSNSVLTVMSKLPDTLLTLLSTNSDVLVVMEDVDGMAELTPTDAVNLALVAIVESAFIYEDFCARYVEPQLAQRDGSAGAARALYAHFEAFLASPTQQVLLLAGDGGTGKTSTSLALTARMIRSAKMKKPGGAAITAAQGASQKKRKPQLGGSAAANSATKRRAGSPGSRRPPTRKGIDGAPDALVDSVADAVSASYLPVFIHLPWAAGLLDPGSTHALTRHIQQQMYLDQGQEDSREQLAELQRRPLVIFLDSIDELRGDVGLLRRDTLLQRGGIELDDWPETKFVATCRGEFLDQHQLTLSHITPRPTQAVRTDMLPFNMQAVCTYVRQAITIEARRLAKDLHGKADGDVQAAVDAMRTVQLPREKVAELQRALHGRRAHLVPARDIRKLAWQRTQGGVVAMPKGGCKGLRTVFMQSMPWSTPAATATVRAGTVVAKVNGAVVSNGQDVKTACDGGAEMATIETVCPFANAGEAVNAVLNSPVGAACIDYLCHATNAILRRFHCSAEGLLGVPFVLYMVVSAAPELERRPRELVAAEPRCQVYEVWLRQNIRDRLPRQPRLREHVADPLLREELVVSAATRLACSMYAAGEWHSTVGRCLKLVDHPTSAGSGALGLQRALLGCMPLRVEQIERDSSPLSWRHRTLMEYLIARAVAQEFLTARKIVLASRPLQEHAPEVVLFFQERTRALRLLRPALCAELEDGLQLLRNGSDGASVANATVLLACASGMSPAALAQVPAASTGLRRLTVRRNSYRSTAPRKQILQRDEYFHSGKLLLLGVLNTAKTKHNSDKPEFALSVRVYDDSGAELCVGRALEHSSQVSVRVKKEDWRELHVLGVVFKGDCTVGAVETGQAAAQAGVTEGMELVAVGVHAVSTLAEADAMVKRAAGGSVVLLFQGGVSTCGAGHPFYDEAYRVDLAVMPIAASVILASLTEAPGAPVHPLGSQTPFHCVVAEAERDRAAAAWGARVGHLCELRRQGERWRLYTAGQLSPQAPSAALLGGSAQATALSSGHRSKSPRHSLLAIAPYPSDSHARGGAFLAAPQGRTDLSTPVQPQAVAVGSVVRLVGPPSAVGPLDLAYGPMHADELGEVQAMTSTQDGSLCQVRGRNGTWWYNTSRVEVLDTGQSVSCAAAATDGLDVPMEVRASMSRLSGTNGSATLLERVTGRPRSDSDSTSRLTPVESAPSGIPVGATVPYQNFIGTTVKAAHADGTYDVEIPAVGTRRVTLTDSPIEKPSPLPTTANVEQSTRLWAQMRQPLLGPSEQVPLFPRRPLTTNRNPLSQQVSL